MTDINTVLVDMRWTETGWQELFTSRLLGWLPQKQFENLVSAGHFAAGGKNTAKQMLTASAKAWTDPHDDADELMLKQLAETLVFVGIDRWRFYTMPIEAVCLHERDVFDQPFREKVLRYLVWAAL